jgi:hypothetical protein
VKTTVERGLAMAIARDILSKGSGAKDREMRAATMLREALIEIGNYDVRMRTTVTQRDDIRNGFRKLSNEARGRVLDLRTMRFERDRSKIAFDQAVAMIDRLMAYHVDPASLTDQIRSEIASLKAEVAVENQPKETT